MSKFWLFTDKLITAPFYMIGYIASAGVNTFWHGWVSYQDKYRKAKEGKL